MLGTMVTKSYLKGTYGNMKVDGAEHNKADFGNSQVGWIIP